MDNKQQNETANTECIEDIQQTPVMPIYPVMPMPFDPFCPQFTLEEALDKGTLFKWLYDPYVPEHKPVPRIRGLFG